MYSRSPWLLPWFWSWFSAIAVILRHGPDNERTVCNFSLWTVADVCKKLESRAVAEKLHDAVKKFDTYRNLQRHRTVLPAIARGFLVCNAMRYVNLRFTYLLTYFVVKRTLNHRIVPYNLSSATTGHWTFRTWAHALLTTASGKQCHSLSECSWRANQPQGTNMSRHHLQRRGQVAEENCTRHSIPERS